MFQVDIKIGITECGLF